MHVHDVATGSLGAPVGDAGGEQERRVPERALVAGVVGVTLDAVAAGGAVVRDLPGVAEVALRRAAGVVVGLGRLALDLLRHRPAVAADARRRAGVRRL